MTERLLSGCVCACGTLWLCVISTLFHVEMFDITAELNLNLKQCRVFIFGALIRKRLLRRFGRKCDSYIKIDYEEGRRGGVSGVRLADVGVNTKMLGVSLLAKRLSACTTLLHVLSWLIGE